MPGWAKALIVTAIVLGLLIVGVIAAGYLWWVRNKDALRSHAKEAAAAGRMFGQQSDNQGCVDETFSRFKQEPGFFSALNYGEFMRACLEVSRDTPRFCDEVPVGKLLDLIKWRESQCRHYGVPNDQQCGQLLTPVVMFCGARKRGE